MSRFNLSRLALAHQQFVLFAILVFVLSGSYAYVHLGQAEDPDFTVRTMVIQSNWPGATVGQMEGQVADPLEKKLQTLAALDNVKTMVLPGSVRLMVTLRDDLAPAAVPEAWYQVRKKVADMQYTLPHGVQGPFFNDEFGTTYGNVFVLTGKGFSYAQLKDYADTAREAFLRVPDVDQVSQIDVQDQRIFVEYSNAKLAALGLDPDQIVETLKSVNAVQAAGMAQTRDQQVRIQVSGSFDSVQAIRDLGIQAHGQIFRLGDVATISRGYVDPPVTRMYFNGEPALGLAISMRSGGDVLALGAGLQAVAARLQQQFPLGVMLETVSDQPRVVKSAVDEFTESLYEAVGIVLVVCFLSLGLRTGFVVALCIPFVLAITFFVMYLGGIDLQRISLGALIIGLGLMVDDAIIAVEMMVLKLEEGWDRVRAASFAYVSTAFPMLTGTLITVAGFLPVYMARTSSAEYTRSLFEVVGVSLIVSWFVAVLVTPYIGYKLLPDFSRRVRDERAVYQGAFYQGFRALVTWCVNRRLGVVMVTVCLFMGAVGLFSRVPQQFFPSSDRPELIVDLWFPQNVAFDEIRRQSRKMEQALLGHEDIVSVTTYAGQGSPRFYLPLNVQTQNNLAELVVMTPGIAARERVLQRVQHLLETSFPGLRGRVTRLENGPPVGYPIQLRLSGPDGTALRAMADKVMGLLRARKDVRDVNIDWGDAVTTLMVDVNQDQARTLGVSSRSIAQALQTSLSGFGITQFYEGDETLDIVARLEPAERGDLGKLKDLYVRTRSGGFVPLTQIATLRVGSESSMLWRRNGVPTITVQADAAPGVQANDVSAAVWPAIQAYAQTLPPAYDIVQGGALESSQRSQAAIKAVLPLVAIVVLFLLMIQLQHMGKMLLVVLTAPLGMIGVTAVMLAFQIPFGFVAMLGVLALFGMIIRNSVILIVQIGQAQSDGASLRDAIIESTVHRLRPILLTAAAAVLAMIPLTQSVFWGPMAWAIMGGLTGATLLTLLFLPAAYALAFRLGKAEGKRG